MEDVTLNYRPIWSLALKFIKRKDPWWSGGVQMEDVTLNYRPIWSLALKFTYPLL